jgi:hypothetical protein
MSKGLKSPEFLTFTFSTPSLQIVPRYRGFPAWGHRRRSLPPHCKSSQGITSAQKPSCQERGRARCCDLAAIRFQVFGLATGQAALASAELIVNERNADEDRLVREIVVRSEQSRIHEKRPVLLDDAVAPVDMI